MTINMAAIKVLIWVVTQLSKNLLRYAGIWGAGDASLYNETELPFRNLGKPSDKSGER